MYEGYADNVVADVYYGDLDDDDCVKGKVKHELKELADLLDEFNNGEMSGCACEWDQLIVISGCHTIEIWHLK